MRKLGISAIVLICLSACSKQPQDKFIGSWNYVGSGKLMTIPLKCAIDLTVVKNDKSYTLTTLSLHLTPSVFGLSGGEFFHNANLTIKSDNVMLTPILPSSGTPITITYLKDTNQLSLNPDPCNGITSGGLLNKK